MLRTSTTEALLRLVSNLVAEGLNSSF
jgi:hypothetical protein